MGKTTKLTRKMAGLVKKSFACWRTAKAWDSIKTADLALELVVVGQLFIYKKDESVRIMCNAETTGENILIAMSRSA